MSKSRHTLGPWILQVYDKRSQRTKEGNTNCYYSVSSNDGSPIQIPSKNEANARLIAAAPVMLEALKVALKVMLIQCNPTAHYVEIDSVRKAIAKARGE